MDPIQEKFERSVAEEFFEWFNAQYGTNYSFFRRAGDAPDLVFKSSENELLVEITAAYYDGAHGAFLWKGARAAPDAPSGWTGANPHRSLAAAISKSVAKKCSNRYGTQTILLVNVPPGLTTAEELFRLMSESSFPKENPFLGVYVCGRFPISTSSAGGYRVYAVKNILSQPTDGPQA
jgi:hypothetical protein